MILESIALQDRGYQPGEHLEDGDSVNLGDSGEEPEDACMPIHGHGSTVSHFVCIPYLLF